ncbi:hypothetical protein [Allokutzneria albata]|nr:hypothetical protein [Allokutzneria albata]
MSAFQCTALPVAQTGTVLVPPASWPNFPLESCLVHVATAALS